MKKIVFLFLGIFCLFLQSCIEITQKIQFKKNGSGIVEFSLDYSKMQSLLGSDMPNLTDDPYIRKNGKGIEKIVGITAVKQKKKDGIETLTFKFKDITALNQAMETLWGNANQKPTFVIHDRTWEFSPAQFGSFPDFMSGQKDTKEEIEGGGDVVEDYSNGLKSKEKEEMKGNFDLIKTMFGEPKINFEIEFVHFIQSVSDPEAQIIREKKLIRSYPLLSTENPTKNNSIIVQFK